MRKSMKKLALNRETLNNMGLRGVQGGVINTGACTNRCSYACTEGCPGGTGITDSAPGVPTHLCSAACGPTLGCPTDGCP